MPGKYLLPFFLILLTLGGVSAHIRQAAMLAGIHEVLIYCEGEVVPVQLGPGDRIGYIWTHSVEGTLITEEYRVSDGTLILSRVVSHSFGAGHPYNAEELNGTLIFRNNSMVYLVNQPVGRSVWIIGSPEFYSAIYVVGGGRNTTLCSGFSEASFTVLDGSP